jgi:hypothetical protein
MTSIIGLSWQALTDRKLRSALTVLMVLIGVGIDYICSRHEYWCS